MSLNEKEQAAFDVTIRRESVDRKALAAAQKGERLEKLVEREVETITVGDVAKVSAEELIGDA